MNFNFTIIIFLMVISYFLLNKEIYEYMYDIRKIFLVLYEIRKFVKYIRNANTNHYQVNALNKIDFGSVAFDFAIV